MVVIVDNTRRKRRFELLHKIRRAMIPAAVMNTEEAENYFFELAMRRGRESGYIGAVTVICFSDEEAMVSSQLTEAKNVTRLVVGGATGVDMVSDANTTALTDELHGLYRELYDIDLGSCKYGRVRIVGEKVLFCGLEIYLTKRERMILNHMILNYGYWQTEEEIQAFCLNDEKKRKIGCAAVHICNLNEKAIAVTGRRIIAYRRYSGYRINEI